MEPQGKWVNGFHDLEDRDRVPYKKFNYFTDSFGNTSDANPNGEVDDRLVRSGTGDWLYHCHIISHVKHGMWAIFRVTDPGTKSTDDAGN